MIRPRTWRGIALLSVLAALSWQLARKPAETLTPERDAPDTRLNYALYDFEGRLLDDQGQVQIDLSAPELRNDADSGVGTVLTPEIRIQQEQDQWYITAESAVVSADRETVTLEGAVSLSRRNALTDEVLDISTSDVVLNVSPRTARTDADVRIRQRGDWLDAVGMRLDMNNERYELLNDVRAHYQVR